ncbi:MAG TPA: M20 family metallopeptidase [Acidimicrobiales bacterium]|nr:M20 family metallopeptidase [Acidimicrobiales bacterium]
MSTTTSPAARAAALKARVVDVVDRITPELLAASREIHANPELGYEEHFASARLAGLLRDHGLDVEHPAYDLPTAFAARGGDPASDAPLLVVCCEYDALPGIGHGCGHNVIGTAGVGAGIALASVAAEAGGRVLVLGTPAEERNGGGKIRLLERGAFAGAAMAMMIHPEPGNVERAPYLAADDLEVVFHGKAAHASSQPHKGVNALDALVLGYMSLATLRQYLRPDEKVHGIITDGGQAENIVPVRAAARFKVRAKTEERLEKLKVRVLACFEGAATQTGARLEATYHGGYSDGRWNHALASAFRRNGEALGRRFVEPELIPDNVAGSTDMGNVSKALPAIHPVIQMCPLGVAGHSEEMAQWAASEKADAAVVDGAKALAMTGVDVWTDPDLLAAAWREFEGDR